MARRRFPISLVMIVRDEARVLARCLDSVTGLVDEIVVVDTGSTDDTIAIATSYGAQVHHFTWVDDFAAARNHALSKATHPWRLVLDADEWIVDRDAAKTVLDKIGHQRPTYVGNIGMLQADDDGALRDAVTPQPFARLLPRAVTYEGRIHEQPIHRLRTMALPIVLGHSGYTTSAMAQKEGRNASLLLASLDAEPRDARAWYLLGQEHFTRGRFDEALPALVEAFNLFHAEEGAAAPSKDVADHHTTLALLFTLISLQRLEDAIALSEVAVTDWPASPDIHFLAGSALRAHARRVESADPVAAAELTGLAVTLWRRAATLPDRAEYAGILAERGSALAAQRLAEEDARVSRRFPISLVMIVRDEARVLARCLDSVQGLVDEIVVVDTGSTDDTIAIATSYGAKVHHFTWVDDFAAARNHALSKATHPWRLVLDADEWIVDRDAAKTVLDKIGDMKPDHAGGIDLLQADDEGNLNTDVVPQSLIRLLPPQLSYTGRIHEQPVPAIRAVRLGLMVGHDGYAAQALARKNGRNTELLVAAIDDEPDNPYLWYQLGNEYVGRDQEEQALPYLVQAYNLLHPAVVTPETPAQADWWHRVSIRLMMALTATGRHDDAVALGEVEAEAWPDSPDLHYVLGCAVRAQAVSMRDSDRDRAEALMVASLGLWLHATTLDDQQRYAGMLAGRGTVLAAELVAADYAVMGRHAEAEHYRRLATSPQRASA